MSSYDTNKWMYVPDYYTSYRYILGTKGKKPLICIGINPSTAEPDNLDPTLKSVERIAHNNGYDSFIMFNVYAQRATDPNDTDKEINAQLHADNMKEFDKLLSDYDNPDLWAAWGTIIEKRPYFISCLKDMVDIGNKHNARWLCAGKCSKKGHPHHPLYLRKDETVVPYDVSKYFE